MGRWWSIDPKANELQWQSPYCSMDNNPVWHNDPKGDKIIIRNQWKDDKGNVHEKNVVYKKGKLYDLNGKLYTPEKGGYFEKVQNDLNLLKGDGERSKNVVNQLDNSKKYSYYFKSCIRKTKR